MRTRVGSITDAAGKQEFLKLLYQRFFSVAMKKASDRLGIVYTPTEIVEFILRSVDDILKEQFDSSLSSKGVHILDPFTGTGTFIAQLLHSDLITDADLPRKYREELHANEINLLAYYVAAVNIEEAYHSRMGGNYVPFDGVLLTDTFQMYEDGDELDAEGVFEDNNAGVVAQMDLPITVIVGNPPYSVGQSSGNDDNQNVAYPTLDAKIKATYAARSSAQNKNNLYDSYIRAIRWASDRIGSRGVIGFVTNGGFIEGNTADGMRKVLAEEFSDLYIFNLRGNARTSGEQRRKERDSVFGQGTRTTIAIAILVKGASNSRGVLYSDIGDYLTTREKLRTIQERERASGIAWSPRSGEDWVSESDPEFELYVSLGEKKNTTDARHFWTYSRALATGRDAWVYNFSRGTLESNAASMTSFFNAQVAAYAQASKAGKSWNRDYSAHKFSWNHGDSARLEQKKTLAFDPAKLALSIYRPFTREYVVFDRTLVDAIYLLPRLFPSDTVANAGFIVAGPGAAVSFAALMVSSVPDLSIFGAQSNAQFFPRYSYEKRVTDDNQLGGFDGEDAEEYTRVDNVTDEILADYRTSYGDDVGKDDIFFYVYGLLYSPEYRERFAADLKKMLPRIPKVKDFAGFAEAGRQLSELHLGYETIEPWPLEEVGDQTALLVTKMKYPSKTDKSAVIVNEKLTLTGIPPEAHEYMLGSRSALDWILERYQIKTDKPSGIVNDPNKWGEEHGDPRYIVDLVKRITRVSVETVAIVKALPALDILE